MSVAVEQLTALLRESGDAKHRTDPSHYERKARAFDAFAAENNEMSSDARMFAARARARAVELRAKAKT